MSGYVRAPHATVRHLGIWAYEKPTPNLTQGKPHPLCGTRPGTRWGFGPGVAHLRLCSRCLSELDKLNEAATAVGR